MSCIHRAFWDRSRLKLNHSSTWVCFSYTVICPGCSPAFFSVRKKRPLDRIFGEESFPSPFRLSVHGIHPSHTSWAAQGLEAQAISFISNLSATNSVGWCTEIILHRCHFSLACKIQIYVWPLDAHGRIFQTVSARNVAHSPNMLLTMLLC